MEISKKKNTATYIMFPLIDATNAPDYWSGMTWASAANTSIKGRYSDSNAAYASQAISNTPVEYDTDGLFSLQLTQAEMNHDKLTIILNADEIQEQTILIDTTQRTALASAVSALAIEANVYGHVGSGLTAYGAAKTGDAMTLTGDYDDAKTASQAGDAMTLTGDYDASKTAAQAGDAMTLTGDYDDAKTAAQAGDAMTLTGDYDDAKTAAQAGDQMDLVDAPNSTAITAIQSGLSTFDSSNDEVDIGKVKGTGVSSVNDFKATGFAVAGDAMTLTGDYDAAKTASTQTSVDTVDGIVDDIKEVTEKLDTMIEEI